LKLTTGWRRLLLAACLAHPLGAAPVAGLPVRFEANRGQAHPQAVFLARAAGGLVLLGAGGEALYLLPAGEQEREASAVKIEPLGAAPKPEVRGERLLSGRSHYYRANREDLWIRDVPAYARVRYRELYPGVDLVYYGRDGLIEYDFEVAPGADPGAIRLRVSGPAELRLAADGELVIAGRHGELRHRAPVAYQKRDGKRVMVPASYRLAGDNQVAFQIGDYDPSLALVIDPPLAYATYLGGRRADAAYGLAVDASGAAYVVGETFSTDFPIQQPLQSSLKADRDVFVAKLNATGTALVYATFIGGSQSDRGRAIALDASGNAYITGFTTSADFPVTSGVFNRTYGGLEDGFVAKISSSGTLAYSAYLGAGGSDFPAAIAVDATGNAYVAGYTSSVSFPVTSGALQVAFRGGYYDAFVAKLNQSGSALLYSTYLGGSGNDTATGIAVNAAGEAYVSGQTASGDFPVVSAFQTSRGGSNDAFVAKLNAAGTGLVYSTYLGGSGPDQAAAIAVDSSGRACVTGAAGSVNFPVTSGTFRTVNAGGYDVFVSCLEPAGNALSFSTLIGGSAAEEATAIAIQDGVAVWVAGYTQSSNFPLQSAFQTTYKGNTDAFLATLNANGTALLQSSFLGGSAYDAATALGLDSAGNPYVAGWTFSTDFPATSGAFRVSAPGAGDAFVAKLSGNLPPAAVSVSPSSGTGYSQTFRVTASDPNGFADLESVHLLIQSTPAAANSCYVAYGRAANRLWLLSDEGTAWLGPITAGTAGTLENSQCSVNAAASVAGGSGDSLAVDVALSFKASFAGLRKIYLSARDNGGLTSEWRELGAWTVGSGVNQAPSVVSVTPSSGSGTSQTFTFLFSDPNGAGDLRYMFMLIGDRVRGDGVCLPHYDGSKLWLVNDAGTGWLGPLTPGAAGTLENSQCAINGGASGVSASGTNLTVQLAISFKAAFAGAKTVYMQAIDRGGLDTGTQARGTWTVGGGVNQAPSVVSVTPSSGSGTSQTFTFLFSDPDGAGDLRYMFMLIGDRVRGDGVCLPHYDGSKLWLVNDAGTGWLGPLTPGAAGTLENSQCAINGGASGVSASGTNLTVQLAISFKAAFAGAKTVYMQAIDRGGLDTGTQARGVWQVP